MYRLGGSVVLRGCVLRLGGSFGYVGAGYLGTGCRVPPALIAMMPEHRRFDPGGRRVCLSPR